MRRGGVRWGEERRGAVQRVEGCGEVGYVWRRRGEEGRDEVVWVRCGVRVWVRRVGVGAGAVRSCRAGFVIGAFFISHF